MERPRRGIGKPLTLATWDVRSLFQVGASRNFETDVKRYKIDVAAIQEIRWKDTQVVSLRDYTLINSGHRQNKWGRDSR